ncbi:hypothetical protein DUI87_23920 [Hirundo rustica rustica]|uniref:Uncharacterized protein n=1 Tax=Hirundo rustica rustica TaxID=333673 RepID=A0A3M0JXN0_HIRRU|nr:hypothetical protein DUI87_23920 [Hirundo rustica rustica]
MAEPGERRAAAGDSGGGCAGLGGQQNKRLWFDVPLKGDARPGTGRNRGAGLAPGRGDEEANPAEEEDEEVWEDGDSGHRRLGEAQLQAILYFRMNCKKTLWGPGVQTKDILKDTLKPKAAKSTVPQSIDKCTFVESVEMRTFALVPNLAKDRMQPYVGYIDA